MLNKKLTIEVSLPFWLQGEHLIETDECAEMDEQVDTDIGPLDGRRVWHVIVDLGRVFGFRFADIVLFDEFGCVSRSGCPVCEAP